MATDDGATSGGLLTAGRTEPPPGAALRRSLDAASAALARLEPLLALGARLYVGWAFLKSGLLKAQDWESTLALFQYEYRVPLLPSSVAALLGTAAELILPALVILGLLGRLSALALFLVNAVAVISYSHVLLQEGFEAAVAQHYLWGFMLLVLTVYGPGALSVDRLILARSTTAVARAARAAD